LQPILFNWRTNLLYPLFPTTDFREPDEHYGGLIQIHYFLEDFLSIFFFAAYQIEGIIPLFHKIIIYTHMHYKGTLHKPKAPILTDKLILERFPIIAHTQDAFLGKLQMALSFVILFSYIFPIVNTVKVNIK